MKRELRDQLKAKYPTAFGQAAGWAVGDGWYAILDRLGASLSKLKPITAITGIGEKYGFLDLDYGTANDDAEALLTAASAASESTCEMCGEPGHIEAKQSWLRSRCDICRAMDRPAVGGVH